MALERFHRYRALIDDWSAFEEACQTPLPTCIWAHPHRLTPEALARRLRARGCSLTPVPWYPGAFRIDLEEGIGSLLEYLVGLFHVQEEVSLLPVQLLAPKPGERVLDLCAAPGNKTAQIALAMEHRGTVVANDVNPNRMRALRRIVNRLGLVNVTTTVASGANFPRQAHLFDRVLVDVPCSCEGTSRKNPEILRERDYVPHLARLQTAILTRGLQLCKPGGRVVYSTCTYAPEENEMVLQRALEAVASKIEAQIVKPALPGLRHAPGLAYWQGRKFRADMCNAVRIYPHQNDTGGFFVAVLEVQERARRTEASQAEATWRPNLEPREPWLSYLESRFGLSPTLFEDLDLVRLNVKTVTLKHRETQPPVQPTPHFVGIPFFTTNLRYPKPSTATALLFGAHAKRNVLPLDATRATAYLRRDPVSLAPHESLTELEEGYVVVQHDGFPLGFGLFFPRPTGAELRSLFPKAWRVVRDGASL